MGRRTHSFVLLALAAQAMLASAEVPRAVRPFRAAVEFGLADTPGWQADQTPADFLDGIGSRVKARWRQLYRSAPPPPSTVRSLSAFTLGGLVADSFLALQASDAQQFRNNNQDVMNYCRVLGLNEKLTPRFLSQGKLAEKDHWQDLRQEVVDGHQELCRVLHEQRDEDLAVLVDLGIWMRLLEMVSGIIAESEDTSVWPLAIGSPALLNDMKTRYGQLTESTRKLEHITQIGDVLDYLCRHWDNDTIPEKDRVTKAHQKIEMLLHKLTPN